MNKYVKTLLIIIGIILFIVFVYNYSMLYNHQQLKVNQIKPIESSSTPIQKLPQRTDEIPDGDYKWVELYMSDSPEIKERVLTYMTKGYITNAEYDEISRLSDENTKQYNQKKRDEFIKKYTIN